MVDAVSRAKDAQAAAGAFVAADKAAKAYRPTTTAAVRAANLAKSNKAAADLVAAVDGFKAARSPHEAPPMPSISSPGSVTLSGGGATPAPSAPVIVGQNGSYLSVTGVAGDHFVVVAAGAPSVELMKGEVGADGTANVDLSALTTNTSVRIKQATMIYSDLSSPYAFTVVVSWTDYQNKPTLSIPATWQVPTSGGVRYFPVSLTFEPLNNPVIFRARVINGNGSPRLIDGDGFTQIDTNFQRHFRIGDSKVYLIPITFKAGTTAGAQCVVEIMEIRGASNDDGSGLQCTVTAVAGNPTDGLAPSPLPTHRAPLKLDTSGATPTQTLDIATMKMGRLGVVSGFGSNNWRTDLSDGNTVQTANGEYGFYSDEVENPSQPACHIIEDKPGGGKQLRLHTEKVSTPFVVGATSYNYMASVIAGNNLAAWRHRTGLWEVDLVCPDRKGAWWAAWMMACDANGVKLWPPEIDGCEGLNHVAPGRWNAGRASTHLHYGPFGSNARLGAIGIESNMQDMGFAPGFVFTDQHTLGIEVTPDTVTMYWDHYEYSQYRNLFHGDLVAQNLTLFPLLNVAVGGDGVGNPGLYNVGSGDMIVRGLRYYADRTDMVLSNATIPFS